MIRERKNAAVLLTIIVLSCNMRACYTGVGSLVSMIRADLGLNNALAGMISSIPVFTFALVCPLASALSRRWGLGRTILGGLGLTLAGILIRSFGGVAGVFLGTAVMAAGIGFQNSLMIGLIKLRCPGQQGLYTSIYTTTMALTAAVGIGASVPVAGVVGWRGALGMWGVVSLICILLWAPQAGRAENRGQTGGQGEKLLGQLFRSPQAWQLMLFMGTQCMLFYCITAWCPTILQGRGFSVEAASRAATLLQVTSLPSTLAVPLLAERYNARRLVLLLNGIYVAGVLVFYFAPNVPLIYLGIVLLSVGMGSGFSFCIFFFSRCSHTAQQAAALSGFAQSGGYVIAGLGPVVMGWIYDQTESWNPPMIFCFAVMLIMCVVSYQSARPGYVFRE